MTDSGSISLFIPPHIGRGDKRSGRAEGGGRTKAAGSGPLPRRCQSADVSAHSGAGVYPGGKVFVPHFKSAPLQKHSPPKQAFYNLLFLDLEQSNGIMAN